MKFDKNKFLSMLIKASGCIMAFTFVIANVSAHSTCMFLYHQPKVPASLLESDDE